MKQFFISANLKCAAIIGKNLFHKIFFGIFSIKWDAYLNNCETDYLLSPYPFNIYDEVLFKKALGGTNYRISIEGGGRFQITKFAYL